MKRTDAGHAALRIYWCLAVLTAAGALTAGILGGSSSVLGFLTGAAFSSVNFFFWHRLVYRIGEPSERNGGVRKTSAVLFGVRYGLFALSGYVILKFLGASLLAALAGCFVAVAAAIFEILFELIYGT